jgi:putative endopeptidase
MRSGIVAAARDAAVRPQDDLFGHVNGRWLAETAIPDDRAVHGQFELLRDGAEIDLRVIVEEAAAGNAPAGSPARKVGDLYASFLDEARADRLGVRPIAADLAAIAAVGGSGELLRIMGRLQRQGVGGAVGLSVNTDKGDSGRYVAYLSQSGLGLPDESYYRNDAFAGIRAAYLEHVAAMLALAEVVDDAGAGTAAERVMVLETRLATGHWDVVRSRDAVATYTLVDRAGWEALSPGVDWSEWLSGLDAPELSFDEVVVRQPGFLTAFADALRDVDLADWKHWLAWRVVSAAAPYLSGDLVAESFAFYGRTLSGTPRQRERWKRGVALVSAALGEAAGELYVQRHFPPAAKVRMVELVANLVEAYRRSIEGLDWMGPDTRKRALAKLERFTPKIGYPDAWRDYSALPVARDDLVGNVRAAAEFETARQLAKIGCPVDRGEWFMTPQTVNAYYNPGMNDIVFPAAILQPPFFDVTADDAVNYGAIGSIIGHEIGHGFDDQGSRYDGDGNLVDWWTTEDRERFDRRSQALIEQYAAFEPRDLPGRTVNGALTVGENIGDLGGLGIAYRAYQVALDGAAPPGIDGLTGEQRFFAGWAQCWMTSAREEEALRRLTVDPHAPPEFRANVVRNLDEFYAAYDVTEGDALWLDPAQRVRIW